MTLAHALASSASHLSPRFKLSFQQHVGCNVFQVQSVTLKHAVKIKLVVYQRTQTGCERTRRSKRWWSVCGETILRLSMHLTHKDILVSLA